MPVSEVKLCFQVSSSGTCSCSFKYTRDKTIGNQSNHCSYNKERTHTTTSEQTGFCNYKKRIWIFLFNHSLNPNSGWHACFEINSEWMNVHFINNMIHWILMNFSCEEVGLTLVIIFSYLMFHIVKSYWFLVLCTSVEITYWLKWNYPIGSTSNQTHFPKESLIHK